MYILITDFMLYKINEDKYWHHTALSCEISPGELLIFINSDVSQTCIPTFTI